MKEQHPEIELYINAGNDEQNAAIQQLVDALELDQVVKNTLFGAGVTQAAIVTRLLTDDEGIADLNKPYTQQHQPTQAPSFPFLEKPLGDASADQLWAGT